MLIFQLHFPHVIPNSMQALCALSHLEITFRKAPSQYQHVSLKLGQMTKLLSEKLNCHLIPWFVKSKTFGMLLLMTNLLHSIYLLLLLQQLQLWSLKPL